jgi:hypothetical protein
MSDPAAQAAIAAAIRAFNTELWTLYAFGVLITILRTYARVKAAVGVKNLRADDFLVWLAIVRITGFSKSLPPTFVANAGANSTAALHHTVNSGILRGQSWPRSRKQCHDGRRASRSIPRFYRVRPQVRP